MKSCNMNLKLSAVALAVVSAMTSMSARADDEEVKALTTPVNFVDVQGLWVSQSSAKFGEYNGLNKSGGYINGDLGLFGGSAYSDNENGGTMRYKLTGTNLGLDSRSANLSIADQGNWALGLNYDSLTHNISDSYQTPYNGKMGGNSFTLPANFGLAANTQLLTANQINAFQNMNIWSQRQNTTFGASKVINPNWTVNFDYNHLDMSGAKLMAFGGAAYGGASGERPAVFANPTNSTTDTFTLGTNWVGENARVGASYFGSFYQDAYNSVAFQTFAGANVNQLMGTNPNNQFNQLNLNGGYDFTKTTKAIANLSYGRGTASGNSTGYEPQLMLQAAPSFNAVAVNTHADVKLIDQSLKDLTLSALYRYDKRDNQSSSDMVNANSISGSSPYNYPNTPLSYSKQVIELAGQYKLTRNQTLGLTYNNMQIQRWCNNYAVGVGYPSGTACVTGTSNTSNGVSAYYKIKPTEDLNFRVTYGYDSRNSNYNTNAITAFSTANPNVGMVPGQNSNDYLGFVPFFEAARNQNLVKAVANWQASDALSFSLGGKYTYDQYTNNTYGVQNGQAWSLNFDANYAYSEKGSVVGYVTQQQGYRNLTNYTSSGLTTWSNNLADNATTFGLGFKQDGLFGDKLMLSGDFTYSLATTDYNGTLNSTTLTTDCNVVGTCGNPGQIRNNMQALRLQATYKIDKQQQVALQYMFQHLDSNDYYYNGYALGYTPTSVLPTNQTSPNYNVNVIMLMYRAQL